MDKKISLKVYYEENEMHYVRNCATIISEDTHPELKGMTEEEMIKYVQENIENMRAVDSDSSANLEEQVMYAEQDWDRYSGQSSKVVVEVATEEDIADSGGSDDDDDDDDDSGDDGGDDGGDD